MFAVFQAGTSAAVNVHQYQWGQMGLTSITDDGLIRRWDAGQSPNDGNAM